MFADTSDEFSIIKLRCSQCQVPGGIFFVLQKASILNSIKSDLTILN